MRTGKQGYSISQGNHFLEIGGGVREIDLKLTQRILFQGRVVDRIIIANSEEGYILSGGFGDGQEFKSTLNLGTFNYTTLNGYLEEINIILNN